MKKFTKCAVLRIACITYVLKIDSYLPIELSQNTMNDPSLLRETPFGNWRFRTRTVVSSVFGLYLSTLPLSSPEKTNCIKFLKQ